MTHSAVQDALLDDDVTPDIEAHLEQCSACAAFAGRLETIRRKVDVARPLLAPAPPGDLADRIVDRMRAPTTGTPSGARPRAWPPEAVRRSLVRSAAVAAVLMLLVGLLAVVADHDEDGRHDVLLASAERTEAAGTAEVTVEGHTELGVPVEHEEQGDGVAARPGSPELEAFPPEVHRYMEQQWARIMAEFERQMTAFERQVDESIRRGQEQIDQALREAFENFGQGAPGRPGEAQRPERPSRPTTSAPGDKERPPAPPDRLSLRVDLSAGGQVDFRGRANLEGSVRPTVPSAGVDAAAAGFAVSVDGGNAAVRGSNGSWARVDVDPGPLGAVLLDPGAVGRILRGARGDVDVVGEGEVDGAHVRRYRFDVDADALVRAELAEQEWEAEAAVDDEGRVRTLRLRSRGGVHARSPLTWHTDVTVHLRNFGTAVDARAAGAAEARGTVSPAARSSVLVHPFGPSVAASLESASSKSR